MTKPQQPELRRSGLGGTDQEANELRAQEDRGVSTGGATGRVPPDNRPGHHPRVEQDKPQGRPGNG